MTASGVELKQLIANAPLQSRINLSGLSLTDEEMNIVAAEAIVGKQCTQLDLGSNNITSKGALIIVNALGKSETIRRLYLSDNRIADEGAYHLSLSTENSSLFVLGLSRNGITDDGVQHLSKMLGRNHRLLVLGLEDNEISDFGVANLAAALKQNNTLQRLLLAENKMITDRSFDYLLDIMHKNRSLQRLDLRSCSLSPSIKLELQLVALTKTRFELLY